MLNAGEDGKGLEKEKKKLKTWVVRTLKFKFGTFQKSSCKK